MSQNIALIIFLIMALLSANLPWLTENRFLILSPGEQGKGVAFRLLELGILFGFALGIGFALESKVTGSRHAQDWEFYAVAVCLFVVFSIPGFVYRYILRH